MKYETFAAFIDGYKSAGGVMRATGQVALQGCIGNWLYWLDFNIHLALGDFGSTSDEVDRGLHEVSNTLGFLRSLADHLETWAGWLENHKTNNETLDAEP